MAASTRHNEVIKIPLSKEIPQLLIDIDALESKADDKYQKADLLPQKNIRPTEFTSYFRQSLLCRIKEVSKREQIVAFYKQKHELSQKRAGKEEISSKDISFKKNKSKSLKNYKLHLKNLNDAYAGVVDILENLLHFKEIDFGPNLVQISLWIKKLKNSVQEFLKFEDSIENRRTLYEAYHAELVYYTNLLKHIDSEPNRQKYTDAAMQIINYANEVDINTWPLMKGENLGQKILETAQLVVQPSEKTIEIKEEKSVKKKIDQDSIPKKKMSTHTLHNSIFSETTLPIPDDTFIDPRQDTAPILQQQLMRYPNSASAESCSPSVSMTQDKKELPKSMVKRKHSSDGEVKKSIFQSPISPLSLNASKKQHTDKEENKKIKTYDEIGDRKFPGWHEEGLDKLKLAKLSVTLSPNSQNRRRVHFLVIYNPYMRKAYFPMEDANSFSKDIKSLNKQVSQVHSKSKKSCEFTYVNKKRSNYHAVLEEPIEFKNHRLKLKNRLEKTKLIILREDIPLDQIDLIWTEMQKSYVSFYNQNAQLSELDISKKSLATSTPFDDSNSTSLALVYNYKDDKKLFFILQNESAKTFYIPLAYWIMHFRGFPQTSEKYKFIYNIDKKNGFIKIFPSENFLNFFKSRHYNTMILVDELDSEKWSKEWQKICEDKEEMHKKSKQICKVLNSKDVDKLENILKILCNPFDPLNPDNSPPSSPLAHDSSAAPAPLPLPSTVTAAPSALQTVAKQQMMNVLSGLVTLGYTPETGIKALIYAGQCIEYEQGKQAAMSQQLPMPTSTTWPPSFAPLSMSAALTSSMDLGVLPHIQHPPLSLTSALMTQSIPVTLHQSSQTSMPVLSSAGSSSSTSHSITQVLPMAADSLSSNGSVCQSQSVSALYTSPHTFFNSQLPGTITPIVSPHLPVSPQSPPTWPIEGDDLSSISHSQNNNNAHSS